MPSLMATTYSSTSSPGPATATATDLRTQAERTRDERSDAETLLALKRSTDRHHSPAFANSQRDDRHGTAYPPSPARSSRAVEVQEYHSLDDAVGYTSQAERSPGLEHEIGPPSSGAPSPSAMLGNGQVCRYVQNDP
jgi:hypothetical protein